jgi:hypothetical protein
MPVDTKKIQQTGFKKGVSGNPAGRPRGSRNKTTLAVESLLDGEAEQLTRTAIKRALAGDMTALKLCLERIVPPNRDLTVRLKLPPLDDASDVAEATAIVIGAVAAGEIGLSAAESVLRLLDAHRRALDSSDIEQRVLALEQAVVESR